MLCARLFLMSHLEKKIGRHSRFDGKIVLKLRFDGKKHSLLASFENTVGVDESPKTWDRAEYSPRPGYLKVAIFT